MSSFSFSAHHAKKLEAGMDQMKAKRNLFDLLDILESAEVEHCLFFGTLLGAVREKGFIPHDSDTDVAVFGDFDAAWPEIKTKAETSGFTVLRGEVGARLFSLMRDDEYIDLYRAAPPRSFPNFFRSWEIDGSRLPDKALFPLKRQDFLGYSVSVPALPETILRILYGKNWRVPVVRFAARPSFAKRIARFLKQKNKWTALMSHLRIERESRGK